MVVGIGSNIEPHKNIVAALNALKKKYDVLQCSPVYKSIANTAKSVEKNCIYYNLVVSFKTIESIVDCKKTLQAIEDRQDRKHNHTDVSCDLDLLLYDNICTTINNIKIPHKDIIECDYVLRPLSDLYPYKQHPELKKTYKMLWESYKGHTTLEPVEFKWGEKLLSIQPTCLSL